MLRATSGAPTRLASKARSLLVDRAHERALVVVEHGRVDRRRAGGPRANSGRAARVEHLVEGAQLARARAAAPPGRRPLAVEGQLGHDARLRSSGSSAGPHVVEDARLGRGRRMQLVGLEELRLVGEPCEQERHQRHVLARRERRIDLAELARVIDAIIRRNHESHEHGLGACAAARAGSSARGWSGSPRSAGRAARRWRPARSPRSPGWWRSRSSARRRSPPAVVSPEMLALTTRHGGRARARRSPSRLHPSLVGGEAVGGREAVAEHHDRARARPARRPRRSSSAAASDEAHRTREDSHLEDRGTGTAL